MKYIYIDESGDLGDSPSSSGYFVIAAILVDNPQDLKRIIKNIKNSYPDIVGRDLEIKGSKTDPNIIKKILARINNIDYEVSAVYLDKKNLHKIPDFYNHHVLYDTLT